MTTTTAPMDINPDTVPKWFRDVLLLATGITAATIIWRFASRSLNRAWHFGKRFIRMVDAVGFIANEMRPNGGGSLKDQVTKAAQDSWEDLELSRAARDEAHRERERLASHIEAVRIESAKRIDALRNEGLVWKEEFEDRLARYFVHEAKGTLPDSNIITEAVQRLKAHGYEPGAVHDLKTDPPTRIHPPHKP